VGTLINILCCYHHVSGLVFAYLLFSVQNKTEIIVERIKIITNHDYILKVKNYFECMEQQELL